jgi:hypothetical protein
LARLGLCPDQFGALVALVAVSRRYRHNGNSDTCIEPHAWPSTIVDAWHQPPFTGGGSQATSARDLGCIRSSCIAADAEDVR